MGCAGSKPTPAPTTTKSTTATLKTTTSTTPSPKTTTPITTTTTSNTATSKTTSSATAPSTTSQFTPLQIRNHNSAAGWNEWTIYNKKVYDTKTIRKVFTPLILEERERQKNEDSSGEETPYDEDESDDDFDDDGYPLYRYDSDIMYNLDSDTTWNQNGVHLVLRSGVPKNVVHSKLSQCCIGVVAEQELSQKNEEFRKDAGLVHEDLLEQQRRNELSQNEQDYMRQVKRWLDSNRDLEHQLQNAQAGNDKPFPLPTIIRNEPGPLQAWIVSWEPMDTELPDGGAWEVLPDGKIEADVCTDEQLDVLAGRIRRKWTGTDLGLMRKRYGDLLIYFADQYYEGDRRSVLEYEGWFDLMTEARAELQALCNES